MCAPLVSSLFQFRYNFYRLLALIMYVFLFCFCGLCGCRLFAYMQIKVPIRAGSKIVLLSAAAAAVVVVNQLLLKKKSLFFSTSGPNELKMAQGG